MQLIEILDLVISSVGGDEKSKFEAHKANLESPRPSDEAASTIDNDIAIIADCISACSKIYERSISDELTEVREKLTDFFTTKCENGKIEEGKEEGAKICAKESTKNTTGLLKSIREEQEKRYEIYKTEPFVSTLALTGKQRENLKKDSLLNHLFCSALPSGGSKFSLPIINAIISSCDDLSRRPDLLLMMIDQACIASGDMSETFDLMVKKNIPTPPENQLIGLLTNSRLSTGKNATKLARSFLRERSDDSIASFILDYRYEGRDLPTRTSVHLEKESLLTNVVIVKDFIELTTFLIKQNKDDLLTKFLKSNANKFLEKVTDHASILGTAMERKMVNTFKILIANGFDPLKRNDDQINPFAIACETQGEIPLGIYLESIREKFGEEKVAEVLSADGSALTHAISGRGYLDVLALLEKNGADISVNRPVNLEIAAKKGHAGVFNKLLGKPSDKEIGEIKKSLQDDVGYVIDRILHGRLSCLTTPIAKSLGESFDKKQSSLTEKDLFKICESSGELVLESFISHMSNVRGYKIEEHVNEKDEGGKTPLYYAINHNAYNNLVLSLLKYGANPNSISPELDAATLAVRNKESGTLKIILESERLNIDSIESAYSESKKIGENILIATAFLKGLRTDQITKLNPSISSDLLLMALGEPEFEPYLGKFGEVAENVFDDLIKAQDVEKLERLLKHFNIRDLINAKGTLAKDSSSQTSERAVFLAKKDGGDESANIPAAFTTPVSGGKLTDRIDREYLNLALKISEKMGSQQSKREKANYVINLLLSHGFKTEDKGIQKRLENVGIKKADCCPGVSNACAIS